MAQRLVLAALVLITLGLGACQVPTDVQQRPSAWRLQPERGAITPSEWTSIPAQLVEYQSANGEVLKAWVWQGWRYDTPTVLFYHGHQGHIGHASQYLRYIIQAGHRVIIPEYQGFGPNEGTASLENMKADGLGAFSMAQQVALQAGSDPRNIMIMSQSIASEVAAEVGRANPGQFLGMVMIGALGVTTGGTSIFSPDANAADVLFGNVSGAGGGIGTNSGRPISSFTDVQGPKIFVHGTFDNIMPYESARNVFASAATPSILMSLDQVGHQPSEFVVLNLFNAIADAFTSAELARLKSLESGGGITVEVNF